MMVMLLVSSNEIILCIVILIHGIVILIHTTIRNDRSIDSNFCSFGKFVLLNCRYQFRLISFN